MSETIDTYKGNFLNEVYQHFIHSTDYNGLPQSSITSCSKEISMQFLLELIKGDKICILSQKIDPNPYIIRFGFPPKEKQIQYLQKHTQNEDLVLYPSPSYLKMNRDVSMELLRPFNRMMALGYPQLKACYFEYSILYHYAFDPRMNFKFNNYQGEIHSVLNIDERQSINLKTFGIGRDGDDIVIVAFPRYLQNMSEMNQSVWYNHMVRDPSNCKVLKNYIDNEFQMCWSFPDTVYCAILKEIINLKELTSEAFQKSIFLKTFKKDELEGFDILLFPTLEKYNHFLLLMEKVVTSNIDIHFFKEFMSITKDGKTRGSLECLKEWVSHINNEYCDKILIPLKCLRKERQDPAHKIQRNKYSNGYLLRQHSLCTSIYNSLNLLRRLIQTHPKLRKFEISYPQIKYIEI